MAEYSTQPRRLNSGHFRCFGEELSSIALWRKRGGEDLGDKGLRGVWLGKDKLQVHIVDE